MSSTRKLHTPLLNAKHQKHARVVWATGARGTRGIEQSRTADRSTEFIRRQPGDGCCRNTCGPGNGRHNTLEVHFCRQFFFLLCTHPLTHFGHSLVFIISHIAWQSFSIWPQRNSKMSYVWVWLFYEFQERYYSYNKAMKANGERKGGFRGLWGLSREIKNQIKTKYG